MLVFGSTATGPSSAGVLSHIVVQAGSAADIQAELDVLLADAAAAIPNEYLLTINLASAGDGNQFALVVSHAVGYVNSAFSGSTAPFNSCPPPTFATFTAAVPALGRLFVTQGGTAEEALAKSKALVEAAKAANPPGSANTMQFGPVLAGASNGQQWMAATLLTLMIPSS